MKTTKKTFMTLIISFTMMATMLFAQPGGRPQQGPPQGPPMPNDKQIKEMVTELSSTLELNKKQSQELSDLYTAHFKDIKAQMKKGQKSHNKSKDKMDKLKKQFDKDIKSILTPEQQKAFEIYQKEHMQKGREDQHQHSPKRN